MAERLDAEYRGEREHIVTFNIEGNMGRIPYEHRGLMREYWNDIHMQWSFGYVQSGYRQQRTALQTLHVFKHVFIHGATTHAFKHAFFTRHVSTRAEM